MNILLKTKLVKLTFTMIVCALILSCSSGSNAENYTDIFEEPVKSTSLTTSNYNDSLVLAEVASLFIEAQHFGQLAYKKCHLKHVQNLGAVMEIEHQKYLKDLNYLAEAKLICLNTVLLLDSVEEYTLLNNQSGLTFDKAYCSNVIQKHLDAIVLLERAMNESEDPDIRDWSSALLSELRAHVEIARICEQKCDKAVEENNQNDISQRWDISKKHF